MLNIIQEIKETPSKSEKIRLLSNELHNEDFKTVLKMTYSPVFKLGVKELPVLPLSGKDYPLSSLFPLLKEIAASGGVNNQKKEELANAIADLNADDASIAMMIVKQTLDAGISSSSINKAFGRNFIKDVNYMGCKPFSEKGVDALFAKGLEVHSQIKYDGRYMNLSIVNGVTNAESRQGLLCNLAGVFDNFKVFNDLLGNVVLNGELMIKGVSRYESNGIIASLISIGKKIDEGSPSLSKDFEKLISKHGSSYQDFLSKLTYIVWDFQPFWVYTDADTWEVTYSKRFKQLTDAVRVCGLDNIEIANSQLVANKAEAKKLFLEAVNSGEEGTVLKADMPFKDGKPVGYNIKMKVIIDFDLVVTGFNLGTGKNSGVISSLNVASSCGLLVTAPTGLTEKEMEFVTANQEKLLGTVVEVQCCGISQNSTGAYSVLHPVFLRFRDDKGVADSLENCKQIESMAKALT